jgi:alpha-tubulin suppressor-like RCC1 family protein
LNRVGQVLGFGDNDYGQLGLGDFERRLSPEAIEVIDDSLNQCLIIAISAGHSHSLVLDDQGRVFSFGNNEYGQLGLAEEGVGSTYREDPVPYPTMIQQVQDVVAISAGSRHSLLLDSYGLVWAFGWGIYGELGVGTYLPTFYPKMSKEIQEVIAIYAGEEFSLFIDAQDHVFSCGQYKQGQLGLEISPGRTEPITKPTMIKDFII